MYQANTPSITVGKVTNVDRGIRANSEQLWRKAFCTLNQRRRLLAAIGALFRQITADPQPNSAYHLGTYVPFLDSTQRPVHRND